MAGSPAVSYTTEEPTKGAGDRRREVIQGYTDDVRKARDILFNAGASEAAIQIISSNPGLASLVVFQPSLAQAWADKYPNPTPGAYSAYDIEFAGMESIRPGFIPEGGFTAASGNRKVAQGVIIATDPASGTEQVIYDDPNGTIAGSLNWTKKVWDWSDKRVAKWRKTLIDKGYLPDTQEKGGADKTFVDSLKTYHDNKWIHGRAVPLSSPASEEELKPVRPDPAMVRNAVRAQFRRVFNNDPSDAELEDWTHFVTRTSVDLQKHKEYDPGQATATAEERFIEKVEQSPQGQEALDKQDTRLELSKLPSMLLSIGEITGGV